MFSLTYANSLEKRLRGVRARPPIGQIFHASFKEENRQPESMSSKLTFIRSLMSNGTSNIVDDVLFHNKNLARVISLNRPGKLNSLNTSMVSKIYPRLVEYAKSDINNMIILDSTSPKGLCAGGDVAEAAKEILNDNSDYAVNFFKGEYNLNFLIGTYPKPFIALMDGITMGGGVGLSVHAPFRISTDTTKLAMPEMDIGFFPDVGTTFFLPRVDDKVGYYVALTGTVLSGLDAYMLGFATHYVPRDRLGSLVNRLSNLQPPNQTNLSVSNQKEYYQQINDIINEFTDTKLPKDYNYPFSTEQLIVIKEAFSQPTFDDVLKYLVDSSSQFAKETLEKLLAKSPTSLRVGFELMNQGAKNSLRKQLELELITAANIMTLNPEINDFVKGVKHKLIDKIKEPSLPEWSPVTDAVKLMTSSIEVGKLEKPLIHSVFNIDYVHYPYNFGVPKNNQIKSFINGTDTKRSYLPTVKEVYSHFKSDKLGTELKLQSTLELHGDLQKYQSKYVSWVE